MDIILIIPIILSFIFTLVTMPYWIKRAMNSGLTGKDMNKSKKPEVAEAGGTIMITGFIIGVLSYVAIKTFYFKSTENLIEIFSLISSTMILSFIGMIDDILGWKRGLGKRIRLFLVLIAAIPLVVINAGHHVIDIPFFGTVNLGLLYPLLLIPIGIVATSTTFNFLAGFNGLEAGQGILIITGLSIVSFLTGSSWLGLIGLCMVFSLLGFFIFNRFPARVFPGDILTYSVGGMIAIMAILGNYERIALFFFIPYILEVILKLRGSLRIESFSLPNKDDSLNLPCKKVCGLEHLAIFILQKIKKDGKVYEKDVVYALYLFQVAIIILGFLIFINDMPLVI